MSRIKSTLVPNLVVASLALALLTAQAFGSTLKFLYNFSGGADGGQPIGTLISDGAGNLYGTTSVGGASNNGTVFQLRKIGGTWHLNVLHSFAGSPTDGGAPQSSLTFDASGNLYGTTSAGGTSNGGTVFKLSRSGSIWSESVLYSFDCCGSDGNLPNSGVFIDAGGTIYGTTTWGGTGTNCSGRNAGCGTFFSLTPSSSGWTETVLHSFAGPPDAALPWGNLVRDSAGNFYETTLWGGSTDCADGCGTVVQLVPGGSGTWTPNVIWATDTVNSLGTSPIGGLIFDSAGNLYGTNTGSVFAMRPASSGWSENLLYTFGAPPDGGEPDTGVVMDAEGNLFGTTTKGGAPMCGITQQGCGTVFELKKSGSTYNEIQLARFHNGENPQSGVVLDAAGNVFGTAFGGGKFGQGGVYEVIP